MYMCMRDISLWFWPPGPNISIYSLVLNSVLIGVAPIARHVERRIPCFLHDIFNLVSSPLQPGTTPALPELDKLNVKTLEIALRVHYVTSVVHNMGQLVMTSVTLAMCRFSVMSLHHDLVHRLY